MDFPLGNGFAGSFLFCERQQGVKIVLREAGASFFFFGLPDFSGVKKKPNNALTWAKALGKNIAPGGFATWFTRCCTRYKARGACGTLKKEATKPKVKIKQKHPQKGFIRINNCRLNSLLGPIFFCIRSSYFIFQFFITQFFTIFLHVLFGGKVQGLSTAYAWSHEITLHDGNENLKGMKSFEVLSGKSGVWTKNSPSGISLKIFKVFCGVLSKEGKLSPWSK